jgi:glycosyltransferase involved in cell wall biosynthesis
VSEADLAIAVVIPVRDGERHLAEALESVLAQDLAPREIVVVDDGSTDRSAEVARAAGPRVRVVSQEAQGAGAARNRGVAETASPWIAFLDADDRWLPGKLRRQHEALAEAAGAAACVSYLRQFFSPELGREDVPQPEYLLGLSPSCLLVAREAFLATGGYSTALRAAEAADWWVRFEAGGPSVVRLEEVLVERRIHGRNTGIVRADARPEFLRLAKRALDRRRAATSPPAPSRGEGSWPRGAPPA